MTAAREKSAKKILLVQLDYDGCFSQNCQEGRLLSPQKIVEHREPFLKEISEKVKNENYTTVKIICGSARQSFDMDQYNSRHNNNPSFFLVLELIVTKLSSLIPEGVTCELDDYLLADTYSNESPGSHFKKALSVLKGKGDAKESKTVLSTNWDHGWLVYDPTKLTMLYGGMHKTASENRDALITCWFFDDRSDLLNLLDSFFRDCSVAMPEKTTLILHQYENDKTQKIYPEIAGSGSVDHNYHNNIKRMVMACDNLLLDNEDETGVATYLSKHKLAQSTMKERKLDVEASMLHPMFPLPEGLKEIIPLLLKKIKKYQPPMPEPLSRRIPMHMMLDPRFLPNRKKQETQHNAAQAAIEDLEKLPNGEIQDTLLAETFIKLEAWAKGFMPPDLKGTIPVTRLIYSQAIAAIKKQVPSVGAATQPLTQTDTSSTAVAIATPQAPSSGGSTLAERSGPAGEVLEHKTSAAPAFMLVDEPLSSERLVPPVIKEKTVIAGEIPSVQVSSLLLPVLPATKKVALKSKPKNTSGNDAMVPEYSRLFNDAANIKQKGSSQATAAFKEAIRKIHDYVREKVIKKSMSESEACHLASSTKQYASSISSNDINATDIFQEKTKQLSGFELTLKSLLMGVVMAGIILLACTYGAPPLPIFSDLHTPFLAAAVTGCLSSFGFFAFRNTSEITHVITAAQAVKMQGRTG